MGMERYMGYRANGPHQAVTEEMATINIDGTLFYVDLAKHEFRQVDNPFNRMTIGDIPEEKGSAILLFDTITKNRHLGNFTPGEKLPEHVRIIIMSPLNDIAPVGMARRQGLPVPNEYSANQKAQGHKTLAPKTKAKTSKHKGQGL